MTERPPARVRQARDRLVKRLAGEPGFVGAGIGALGPGRHEIVVVVADATSELVSKVPSEWEGIPVRTHVGGTPKKF